MYIIINYLHNDVNYCIIIFIQCDLIADYLGNTIMFPFNNNIWKESKSNTLLKTIDKLRNLEKRDCQNKIRHLCNAFRNRTTLVDKR